MTLSKQTENTNLQNEQLRDADGILISIFQK